MAEHSVDHHVDIATHRSTYANFVRGSVALSLICAFVLVALCIFAFGQTLNVFMGFVGLIIGMIAVLIDARSGSQRWLLSVSALVLFALITAISVS